MRLVRLAMLVLVGAMAASQAADPQSYTREERIEVDRQIDKGEGVCPTSLALGGQPIEYPAASIRAKEEGRVAVGICTGANGQAENFKILSGPGIRRLNIATVLWACSRRYEQSKSCAASAEFDWRLKDFPEIKRPEPQSLAVSTDGEWKPPPASVATILRVPEDPSDFGSSSSSRDAYSPSASADRP